MLYDSTKVLLKGILDGLEKAKQPEWDGQIESCHQCLYEMHQMCRPSYRAYQSTSSDKRAAPRPNPEWLARAIPHVKLMLAAIRRRDRTGAMERGNAALAEMNGQIQPIPVDRPKRRTEAGRKPARKPHRRRSESVAHDRIIR
ncbi:MAG TPA: hypothetical protein VMS37_24920 [Verrucomicrobiae bacterium]|nr:hypothetical protein [Verrucomicrobiae bacterium]